MSNDATVAPPLPDGLVVVVKQECATCQTVVPVLEQLAAAEGVHLTVYTQDDPAFPPALDPIHDADLAVSWHHEIETVPTLIKVVDGAEVDRTFGWSRPHWEAVTGIDGLGPGLPELRPGCGSLSVDPDRVDALRVRFTGAKLRSRRIELAALEDEVEALYRRGWTDGLPVVAPTEERVLRMLEGTSRAPDEIVAVVPPDLVEVTVEKVAINAVMAGCLPEYLPVVLACVEAACTDEFNIHGVLATTMPVGPVVIVNGPVRRAIGMNSGVNALGQGNRANSTIGRALQLVVRNVGGGRPGEVDRATLGNPGKVSFCFPEDEEGSPWEPFAASRGAPAGADAITLFAGEGPRCVVDQLSRTPESLASSIAACLRTVHHPKLPLGFDAILVVSPEHARVFAEAGWNRARLEEELLARLQLPGAEIVRGAGGIAEGVPEDFAELTLPKFRPGGLLIVHTGGGAGLFSAIIAGWANGAIGSQPVTKEVAT
jgi:thiol-disulfide isomerase/thioredoxin